MKKAAILIIIFSALLFLVLSSDDVYKKDKKTFPKWKKIERDAIYRIDINKPDEATSFIRNDKTWSMVSPVTSEVDEDSFENLLKAIEAIALSNLVSSKKEKHANFEVNEEKGLNVAVFGKGDSETANFTIGKTAADFIHTFIKKQKSNNVYWAKGFKRHQFDKTANMWRNRTLLKFNKDAAAKITLKTPDSIILIEKTEDNWLVKKPKEFTAEKNTINTMLNILSNFTVSEFEDEKSITDTSLDNPEFAILIESKDGNLGEVIFGKEDEGNIYVKNAGKDQIMKISKARIDAIKKDLDDLREKVLEEKK